MVRLGGLGVSVNGYVVRRAAVSPAGLISRQRIVGSDLKLVH